MLVVCEKCFECDKYLFKNRLTLSSWAQMNSKIRVASERLIHSPFNLKYNCRMSVIPTSVTAFGNKQRKNVHLCLWSISQNVKRTAQFVAEFHFVMRDLTNGQWAIGWCSCDRESCSKSDFAGSFYQHTDCEFKKRRKKLKRWRKYAKKRKKIRRKFHRKILMHLRSFMKGDSRTFFKPQNIRIKNVFKNDKREKKTTM